MPYYRLEWQEKKKIKGVEMAINCAKDFTLSRTEKDPDKMAAKIAEKMFEEIPEFSATLKKIVTNFQKKEFT